MGHFQNNLKAMRLACRIALLLSCRLLNLQHFAEDKAWLDPSTIECQWFTNGAPNATSIEPERRGAEREMFKIEKECDQCVTKLRLSGRIRSELIPSIRSEMDGQDTSKVLDLSEVTLVDLGVVRFLISCEDEGIELVQCPPYVREWMLRERAEGTQSANV